MKKVFKWIGILILTAILGWVAVILAANYVFTKRINLSCDGQQTTTVNWKGKISIEKTHRLESLRIQITTYPFSKTFFLINTDNDLFESSSDGNKYISHIDEQKIVVAKRMDGTYGFTFKAVTFNRLTKTATIEKKIEDKQDQKIEEMVFEGVCKEVVPL